MSRVVLVVLVLMVTWATAQQECFEFCACEDNKAYYCCKDGPCSCTPRDKKKYYIESVENGMVFDIKELKIEAGTEVVLWEKNEGDNQLWNFKDNILTSVKNNQLALELDDTYKRLLIWNKHEGDNQKWKYNPDSTLESFTGKVASYSAGQDKKEDGIKLIPADKDSSSQNQKFKMVEKC